MWYTCKYNYIVNIYFYNSLFICILRILLRNLLKYRVTRSLYDSLYTVHRREKGDGAIEFLNRGKVLEYLLSRLRYGFYRDLWKIKICLKWTII